jgi:hypothetical protein
LHNKVMLLTYWVRCISPWSGSEMCGFVDIPRLKSVSKQSGGLACLSALLTEHQKSKALISWASHNARTHKSRWEGRVKCDDIFQLRIWIVLCCGVISGLIIFGVPSDRALPGDITALSAGDFSELINTPDLKLINQPPKWNSTWDFTWLLLRFVATYLSSITWFEISSHENWSQTRSVAVWSRYLATRELKGNKRAAP